MKPTYDDTILMDGLLLVARKELEKMQEVDTGRLARIVLYNEDGDATRAVVPFRVAAYARKAMGVPATLEQYGRVVFTSKGITVCLPLTAASYVAIIKALVAYNEAAYRSRTRKIRQRIAKLKKGGAAL